MLTGAKWTLRGLIALILLGFLHYTLPQHDIVRVVGTYQERQDFEGWTRLFWNDTGDATLQTSRDVQFIQAILPNGNPMVYRNQDTGWGWPFYFKFDTASLQTQADDAKSTAAAPKWMAVKHYGWRSELLSIFPNAVSLREVAGPDALIIPYFNISLLIVLAALALYLRAKWQAFVARRVEPIIAEVQETWDGVENRAEDAASGAKGIWAKVKAKLGGK
jgi:Protein of unknown function (DUF1523)